MVFRIMVFLIGLAAIFFWGGWGGNAGFVPTAAKIGGGLVLAFATLFACGGVLSLIGPFRGAAARRREEFEDSVPLPSHSRAEGAEPSMEDILASIRRLLSEDEETAAAETERLAKSKPRRRGAEAIECGMEDVLADLRRILSEDEPSAGADGGTGPEPSAPASFVPVGLRALAPREAAAWLAGAAGRMRDRDLEAARAFAKTAELLFACLCVPDRSPACSDELADAAARAARLVSAWEAAMAQPELSAEESFRLDGTRSRLLTLPDVFAERLRLRRAPALDALDVQSEAFDALFPPPKADPLSVSGKTRP